MTKMKMKGYMRQGEAGSCKENKDFLRAMLKEQRLKEATHRSGKDGKGDGRG